jgi:uncharacterized small protein (TIGR04563 family)
MFDLARFRDAQDSPDAGFACALSELEAGRKTSHWIWYIFAQLAGLGGSPMAVRYGLNGPEEMLDEIAAEARRLDRSLSWVVQRAWKLARRAIAELKTHE